ncbi:radical SAM/SPASM domain-containing protein [Magnetospirillum sp. UT-4]|uniref:radical SAM/SPASM domain-containing protein n=1 Tax=Magnetospirillum sp. UT-4 TaxID=2681467 RepID=UPI001383B1ED|nr:radical SAM protein [Magnetospirillum sp. UT-4]CAA7612150.1 hypothetical protein MTBUT4_110079 [Magnetospirillum sp. UT-4]
MKLDGIVKSVHQLNKIRYRPKLLAGIARGYFRTLVLRKPTLRICEFSITAACQSKCEFCYASKFAKKGQQLLSVDEIRNTWRQAKRMGAFSTVLLGGEPLLRRDFMDIIDALEPKDNIVTFTSNAILLTRDMLVDLKRRGVFLVNFSLNSLEAEANDAMRGYDGHRDKVFEVIETCKSLGLDVFLGVATSKKNLQDTISIVDFAREKGLGVTINLMTPMGRAECMGDELFDAEFWATLRDLYNRNPGLRSDYDVNLDLKIGCPAGFEKIHVAPYGDVTGCSMNPASFGNVRDMPLEQIVAKMRSFHHFAKRAPNCIVAVDKEYIGDYSEFAATQAASPYDIELNPNYQKDKVLRAG